MIVGDFEPVDIVNRAISSVKDYVDGLYIAITHEGESPNKNSPLVKALKKHKANISYFKWVKSYCKARQYVMDQTPSGENVFIYWMDADDVLDGAENLPEIISDMITYNQSAVVTTYHYAVSLDNENNIKEILVDQKRERIIRHDGTWKWIGDLHELLIEQRQENVIKVFSDKCKNIHLSTKERAKAAIDRNIEILENMLVEQKGKDPRTSIYLGRTYVDKGKMTEGEERKQYFNYALKLFHQYLNGKGMVGTKDYIVPSGWRAERASAWSQIGEIAVLSGEYEVAIQSYQSAIDEAPEFPNHYIDLAMAYLLVKDFDRAEQWWKNGLNKPMPNTTMVVSPRDLKLRTAQVALEIYMHKNEIDRAIEASKLILEINPEDQFAINNHKILVDISNFNKACQSFVFLGKYLESKNEIKLLGNLVNAMTLEMSREKFASEMKHKFLPKKDWESNEITILCGPSFEKWSPKSIDTGIGGSEEAVVRMAEELTKQGWKVTVYADPREDAGEYNGVEYKQWFDINIKDSFNVLILWRSIGFVDVNPKARFTMLWLHDVPNNAEFTEERMGKIDKIAVLSSYHKSLLRIKQNDGSFIEIPQDKIFLTSNGIPDMSSNVWKGDSKRIIYASSPDRGLIYLLNNWEKIKKDVPEAELHIFYGFDVFDAVHKNNPSMKKWKENILNLMKKDGIIYHGRVGHNALHYEFSKSGIWAYPTDFQEISCITAMKAQALGAIPVVTNYAALEETVKNGLRVDVDITDPEGQNEYIDSLVNILKDEKQQMEIREKMIPWARNYFKWDNVSKTWGELFLISIQKPHKAL